MRREAGASEVREGGEARAGGSGVSEARVSEARAREASELPEPPAAAGKGSAAAGAGVRSVPARGEGRMPRATPRQLATSTDSARPVMREDRPSHPGWHRAGDVLARLAFALTALVLGVVLLVATLTTVWLMTDPTQGNLTQSMSIYTVRSASSLPVLAAGLAGVVATLGLCALARRRGRVLDGRAGTVALVAVTLAFQLAIIFALQTRDTLWGDSWMIDDFADRAVSDGVGSLFLGPYSTIYRDARLYFTCYPFQAAYFWLVYGLKLAFGTGEYLVFQVLSALANELAVVSLLSLGRLVRPGVGARRVLWVLVCLCLPMYWLATFVYGNAMGFGLGMAFLAMQGRAMSVRSGLAGLSGASSGVALGPGASAVRCDGGARPVPGLFRSLAARPLARELAWGLGSLVPLALALTVKATFVLFAIAVVLAWVVLAVRRRSAVGLAACACAFGVAHALSGLPFQALAAASGGYEFGDALTTLNHLELGLRMGRGEFYVSIDDDPAKFAPGGWSDHATQVWAASGENAEVQNAAAARLIAQDVVTFADYPSYAAWFFSVKLATEWGDPTYQALYYLSMAVTDAGARTNPADLATPVGMGATVLTFALDGYQVVTFAGALGWVAAACRGRGRARGRRGASARDADAVARAEGAASSSPAAGAADAAARAAGATARDGRASRGAVAGPVGAGSLATAATPAGSVTPMDPAAVATPAGPATSSVPAPANPATLLLALTFFTGFGCYLLWEAKAVYVLPFAIAVLPLSAAGIDWALDWLGRGDAPDAERDAAQDSAKPTAQDSVEELARDSA